jgi:hypothetical protein
MATIDTNIVPLHPAKPKTPAERAAAYRARKREKAKTDQNPSQVLGVPKPGLGMPKMPVTPKIVTKAAPVTPVTPSRPLAPIMLSVTAFGLAVVGVTMNGWFAKSLGSSEIAGWLFLGVGVAADLVALAIPACAASLWHKRQRAASAVGWLVWLMTFAFALNAGIGFASVNIADVTTSRASRVTPAVEQAQTSLRDAMTSRDRECQGGVGKNCRAREDAVTEQRKNLSAAMAAVEQTADPQVAAASHIVAWVSAGLVKPSGDDLALLRLILLALLPQLGGILLMVSRNA